MSNPSLPAASAIVTGPGGPQTPQREEPQRTPEEVPARPDPGPGGGAADPPVPAPADPDVRPPRPFGDPGLRGIS